MSDFFKNLSENFNSVKMQLDKGRGEFEKLNKKSEENRSKNESDKSEFVQVNQGKQRLVGFNPFLENSREMESECANYTKIEFRKGWNTVDETEEDDAWNSLEADLCNNLEWSILLPNSGKNKSNWNLKS